ncbi:sugar ABC transporter permease [Acidothermaceae bacterium B102]|nr:sugar ABC transporter permease [Acidothermaceae bacterium B102]
MIRRRPLAAVGFVLPAALVYAAFVVYPLVRGVLLTFTDSTGSPGARFVGLRQYRAVQSDPAVQNALVHTLEYVVVVAVAQNVLGLVLASALFRRPRVRNVLTTALLLPALLSPLLAAFVWSFLYAPGAGLGTALADIGVHGLATRVSGVAVVDVWMFTGVSCVVFLAGYVAMPRDLTDAAELDGANGWTRFRLVEWPLLAPALTVSVTVSLVAALRMFELPLVIAGPGGQAQPLSSLVFQKVFATGSTEFGYGAAIALVLLCVVVLAASLSTLLRARAVGTAP